ncbi:MAG: glucose-6-phosphate isomerase, partial [Acidimicrobiales bacterium]
MDIAASPPWRALQDHAAATRHDHLRDIFAADPHRATTHTAEVADLVIDWSKQRVTSETLDLLADLAEHAGVAERITSMVRGEPINTTERRPVLHTALRAPKGTVIEVDGVDVVPRVHDVLRKMTAFADRVRDGDWVGATGRPIRTVVNVGIGGSDLGPVMAHEALAAFRHERLRCRFVSNIDGSDLVAAVDDLDPAETMFIVSSKTFTTVETLTNARSARSWLTGAL